MKRIPWGIFAGVLGVLVFYLTAGIIAAFYILNAIAGATSGSITIFTQWWQTLMFVFDLVFAIGFVFSLVMFILKAIGKFDKEKQA